MPNLRKNPFSMDFDRLFQSTEKKWFMAESTDFFLLGSATNPHRFALSRSRYSTEKKQFLDESTDFFVLSSATTPPHFRFAVFRARREWTSSAVPSELFRLLPEISGFFAIPIGQPCTRYLGIVLCGAIQVNITLFSGKLTTTQPPVTLITLNRTVWLPSDMPPGTDCPYPIRIFFFFGDDTAVSSCDMDLRQITETQVMNMCSETKRFYRQHNYLFPLNFRKTGDFVSRGTRLTYN